MRILISNDDGVFSPALSALHQELSSWAQCTVVAPDQDRSGTSSSITLDRPLYPQQLENGFWSLNGTPVDCVHLGLNALFKESFDMVVAGINLGANLGDDVLYSGTVGAASEGRHLKNAPWAISLASIASNSGASNTGASNSEPSDIKTSNMGTFTHIASAAIIVSRLIKRSHLIQFTEMPIINVNIPDLPLNEIKGFKVCHLSQRHRATQAIKFSNPRGKVGYWIASVSDFKNSGEGTDIHALHHGFVSVTPIWMDKTADRILNELKFAMEETW